MNLFKLIKFNKNIIKQKGKKVKNCVNELLKLKEKIILHGLIILPLVFNISLFWLENKEANLKGLLVMHENLNLTFGNVIASFSCLC